jgi:hypothetical protein
MDAYLLRQATFEEVWMWREGDSEICSRGGVRGRNVTFGKVTSPGACLLGQVSSDVNDIVGDHSETDPAPDAVQLFIE